MSALHPTINRPVEAVLRHVCKELCVQTVSISVASLRPAINGMVGRIDFFFLARHLLFFSLALNVITRDQEFCRTCCQSTFHKGEVPFVRYLIHQQGNSYAHAAHP